MSVGTGKAEKPSKDRQRSERFGAGALAPADKSTSSYLQHFLHAGNNVLAVGELLQRGEMVLHPREQHVLLRLRTHLQNLPVRSTQPTAAARPPPNSRYE